MSPGYLRETAALMRERAKAALPGPWSVDGPWWHADDDRGPDSAAMVTAGTNRVPVSIDPPRRHHAYRDQFANAEHIASWDPAVALAVADWIDSVARNHDGCAQCLGERWHMEDPCMGVTEAIAVARAYRGESR